MAQAGYELRAQLAPRLRIDGRVDGLVQDVPFRFIGERGLEGSRYLLRRPLPVQKRAHHVPSQGCRSRAHQQGGTPRAGSYRRQTRLAELIDPRFAPALLVHSALPPMYACLALPQPLRWFMGRWARRMNHSLAQLLIEQVGRSMHWHPETTKAGMAADGTHPSAEGYAAWADGFR